ncbi:MAG: hypothetical protein K6T65_08740 [Peptococcaceae bacterium]|nr:hypothetical protein [Peptococcaceae bacterium]
MKYNAACEVIPHTHIEIEGVITNVGKGKLEGDKKVCFVKIYDNKERKERIFVVNLANYNDFSQIIGSKIKMTWEGGEGEELIELVEKFRLL